MLCQEQVTVPDALENSASSTEFSRRQFGHMALAALVLLPCPSIQAQEAPSDVVEQESAMRAVVNFYSRLVSQDLSPDFVLESERRNGTTSFFDLRFEGKIVGTFVMEMRTSESYSSYFETVNGIRFREYSYRIDTPSKLSFIRDIQRYHKMNEWLMAFKKDKPDVRLMSPHEEKLLDEKGNGMEVVFDINGPQGRVGRITFRFVSGQTRFSSVELAKDSDGKVVEATQWQHASQAELFRILSEQ